MKFLYLLIISAFIIGCGDDRTEKQKAEIRCESSNSAYYMSQEFIKKMLKSPSSAKFPNYYSDSGIEVTYLGECKHKVSAYVDAQNSFGAMIRSQYTITIQNKKYTQDWAYISGGINE